MSGSPIFYSDETAVKSLNGIADFFLCQLKGNYSALRMKVLSLFLKILINLFFYAAHEVYAPNLLDPKVELQDNILGTGAMLKSTFAFSHLSNIYISQYLGNTIDFDVQTEYKKVYSHLKGLLGFKPELIAVDSHPDYFSTRFGESLSNSLGVPFVKVQHHEAHFGAVLGENDLLQEDNVLGGRLGWNRTWYRLE